MNKKKQGFTLLELIITMMITVIVVGIAGSMFTAGNKVFSDSDVKSTLQIEGQAIQEKISDIGMQGIAVSAVVPDSSLMIESYVKDYDAPRYFKIQKENTNLIIYIYSDENYSNLESEQIISENVNKLSIDNSNSNSIRFDITLTKKKGYSDVTQTIVFATNFRNKSS